MCLCWVIYFLFFYLKKFKNFSNTDGALFKYESLVVRTPNPLPFKLLYLIYLYKPHTFANQVW